MGQGAAAAKKLTEHLHKLLGHSSVLLASAQQASLAAGRSTETIQDISVPATATVWAAAPFTMLPGAKGASAADQSWPTSRFSLCLQQRSLDDHTSAFGVFEVGKDTAERDSAMAISVQSEELRHHMALVGRLGPRITPRLTRKAQDLLDCYYMSVRHSDGAAGIAMSVLEHAVALASASARLMLRTQVEVFPECTLAILLSEESLRLKLGAANYSNLDLGPVLQYGVGSSTLDQQLSGVHARLTRQLAGFHQAGGGGSDDEDGVDGPVGIC
ncbi:hypothetical protein V8C86DRAFT_2522091 [Haematococcus lacustris]